jgi:outer membrane receptor protein involved in Fe transport
MVGNDPQMRLRRGRNQSIHRAGAAILALGSMWSVDVIAQTAPSDQLEEVVVTARKRAENLQATPIAVTAFNAAALEERSVNNIADVGKFVPNVAFQSGAAISGSSTSVTIFIRGIGQTDFTEVIDPGVGVYVDGVYVSRSTGSLLDTSDIANIEVLRGPQGTLFGKNTIGGAVVVTTQKPVDYLEGSVEAVTGAYDRFDVNAMANLPITDKLKIRASGTFQSRDGYVKRLIHGQPGPVRRPHRRPAGRKRRSELQLVGGREPQSRRRPRHDAACGKPQRVLRQLLQQCFVRRELHGADQ